MLRIVATSGFKFLTEKALQTAEELSESKFGHEEIADTLVKVIKECPAPFTVGLFAKWGSGKSTVANSLKNKLPKDNIPVVIFDVWKHEGDALRRTFLKETVRQLREFGGDLFDQNFALDEKLEQSVSRSSESRFIFPTEKLLQLGWPIILGVAGVAFTGWAADYFGYFNFYQYFVTALFGSVTAGGLLIWLVKNALQLFTTETVHYGVDKFGDPHQFEQEFGRLLTALKNPRVLIIFDNLDRVMHDKVAEVLSTIKTFLEPQDLANSKREVVFLVPCDAKAIKQHLSSVYNPADKAGASNAFDPDEFLRKFFNTIVWIPDFIPSELESFAQSRLKETRVPLLDNHYVAWIIIKAFRNNPRQIIQFINILVANYLLVEEREGTGKDFPDGFLKESVPQLTKYLILNQLFPEQMDILREKKILDLSEIDPKELKTSTQFSAFVEETKNIPIPDLRTFFTLRRSEQEKKFPGFETFIAHLEDRNTTDATKYFEQIENLSQADVDFSQAIKQELQSKANPVSTINLIHTLLDILAVKKSVLAPTFYEEINNIFGNGCKEQLHTILPDILNDAFLTRDAKYRKTIVPQWIVVMEDTLGGGSKYKSDREFVKKVVEIFAGQPDYLNATQILKVKELIAVHLPGDIDVARIITQSPQSQALLGNADYIQNYTKAIPNGGAIEDIRTRVEILNKFEDTLLKQAGGEFLVKKFIDLQLGENQNTKPESYPEKKKLLDQYREFMSSHDVTFSASLPATRDAFADSLNTGFNAPADHQVRAVFMPILFELRTFLSDTKKAETELNTAGWVGNVNPDVFKKVLEELTPEDQKTFFEIQSIYDSASNRAVSDQPFREMFFAALSDTRKQQFLEKMLNLDFDRGFEFFEQMATKDIKHIFAIFNKVWAKFDSISPAQKQRLFKFVNKNKGNNDASVREILANRIIACLTTADLSLQQVGQDAFIESTLSKELTRKIIKETFDWVKKPEISPKYQPHALRAIVTGFDEFNQEERNEFMQFLFDEIVRKSNKQSHLVESLNLLKELKPKYEERKPNFEDIKLRIETEPNADLKKVIIEGMDGLRPTKTSRDSEGYWSWVQEEKSKIATAA